MPSQPSTSLAAVRELDHVVLVKHGVDARRRFAEWRRRRQLASVAYGTIPYAEGDCWQNHNLSRSAQRHLHGFLFLSDWYAVLTEGVDDQVVADVCTMALEWDRRFGSLRPDAPVGSGLEVAGMAYHDDTTARRLIQLSHFLRLADDRISPEHRRDVGALLERTARLLATEDFYAGHNNHGLFQDLAIAKYLADQTHGLDPQTEQALAATVADRLQSNLLTAFTTDGVHVENSPGYHFIVALLLAAGVPVLEALGSPRADDLRAMLLGTERFATHVIRPDGTLPPLGDTKPVRLSVGSLTRSYGGESFRWSVSQGRDGAAPADRHAVFPKAGYLLYRSSWRDRSSDFCLLKAGYLSHYHHAADDVALLITSRRTPVIGEAGHFGYDLSDPFVQYAYSQYAHNSVIVGGRPQSRVSGRTGGVDFEELVAGEEGEVVKVRGVNRRSHDYTWTRTLTVVETGHLQPGVGEYDGPIDYVVEDDVDLHGEDSESYEVRWHLAPATRPEPREGGLRLMQGQRHLADMLWESDVSLALSTEKGVVDPEPRGWVFREPGKKWPSTVLVLRGHGPRLRLRTIVRTRT